jgi:hypothetical protein
MTDYIDFIDAPAVRNHLRTLPPLPPAQQCILVAQSEIKPLPEKIAALREIRAATPPESFSRGCWKFQCDDPFPVILDRYLQTREERLARLERTEPGVVYVVETSYSRAYGTPFSTFAAALASVEPLEDDEWPPSIRRRRIDDEDGATLVARLSRDLKVREIDEEGGPDGGNMRIWGGDLPNGYAYVPHPFRRGDLVRQGDAYYVMSENVEETDGRYSMGTDESDMELGGMSWDAESGSFSHSHVFFTRGGLDFVAPADLPEGQRILAAVSLVMRGKDSLVGFLECLTNDDVKFLEEDAIRIVEQEKNGTRPSYRSAILRADHPGLPANLFLWSPTFRESPATVRAQRDAGDAPHFDDAVEITLEPEPRILGGTGDLSPDDVRALRAFVARNLGPLLACWKGELPFDALLAALA